MASRSSNEGRPGWVPTLIVLATLAAVAGWTGIIHQSPAYAATTVFDDEFNGTSLDTTAWVAMNRPGDSSNQEKQCYLPSNAAVGAGNLVLTSKVDSSCAGYSYTSAMVQWRSFNFLYGTIEMRALEAGGKGTWPALWLLGANCQQTNIISPDNIPPCDWPNPGSDEIDITEIKQGNLTTVWQNLITAGPTYQTCLPTVSNVSANWHVYSLTWTASSVIWQIDGITTCTKTTFVPTSPMFLMLNTALGGVGGGPIDNNTLPQTHSIDYVRVTQGTPPPAPTVSTVVPSSGPATGGTPVVITGTNLAGATAVKFGTTSATSYTVNGATQITATSPAGSAGSVDVTVTTPGGTSAINATDKFTYTVTLAPTVTMLAPTTGPAAGSTPVTITGTNLTGATAVKFGTTAATAVTVNSATQIIATSPAGSATVDVTVTTPGGTSAINAADKFTYTATPAPTVTMLAPATGPAAGGTPVTITGTNLTGATAVKFGTTSATSYTVNGATQITATSPAGSAGSVDVTVTTPGGTSAINATDKFTYTVTPAPSVTMLAPATGPAAGGTSVVVTGTNLTGATAVKFGATAATVFTADSATQVTATSPAGVATVDVTVTTPGGTSAISAADKFTYAPAPTVVSLAPNSGPTAGGTSVVITGTNFPITVGALVTVKFGTTAAVAPTVSSATQITVTSPAGSGTVDVTVTTAGGTSATSIADRFAYTLPPTAYTAVTPVRLLDTRNTGGPLGAGGVRNLTVAGITPGAPAGVTAVVLNVTVTNTTAASYLTVYPAGATRPLASSLNWAAGKTIPNLVTVQVGTGGAITLFNGVGATDVVVDLEGYFAAPSGSAGGEVALTPARITDTRTGSGKPNAGNTLGVNGAITVQVTGAGMVPASGASAAILNITVTNTSAGGALTVWPTGSARPLASNLNWAAGQTVPNRVFVPIGTGGQISIFNFAGSADVVVDVSGYFTDATASGKLFTAVSPLRLVDTRLTGQTLGTGGSFTLLVGGLGGVPVGASAVILNVTVTNTNAPSFLVAYPSTVGLPTASDLNWVGGQTVANMAAASLGTTGAITFYNGVGSSDVVVDLAGWFS